MDKATDYRSSVPGFEPYHGDVRFLNVTLQSTHRFFFNIILNFNNFSSLVFMSQNFFGTPIGKIMLCIVSELDFENLWIHVRT